MNAVEVPVSKRIWRRVYWAWRHWWDVFMDPQDELTLLANRFQSDKGNQCFDRHHYTRLYSALFRDFRDHPIRLLELGLLLPGMRRRANQANQAPSLEMWAAYFPNAQILGFDIEDFSYVSLPRCTIFRGDMGSRDDLRELVEQTRGDFDIIIDDGSHASQHQQIALGTLFPHVVAGGIYVIEDLQYQPPKIESPSVPKTRDVLRRAQVNGSFTTPVLTAGEQAYLAGTVADIKLFDSLLPNNVLLGNDALAVIQKHR
jgi:hypothetical protein